MFNFRALAARKHKEQEAGQRERQRRGGISIQALHWFKQQSREGDTPPARAPAALEQVTAAAAAVAAAAAAAAAAARAC